MSLCAELAKKVPNMEEMSQFCEFTFDQIMMIRRVIESTLAQAERRKRIANYDPKTADAVKVLFAKIKPPELGHILKVPLELAEKLKENLQTTSNDPQEPSEVLEDLEATVDSREPAQIIEDILGKLQCIPTKIKYHSERARGCYRLLRKVDYFISVLDSWLKREKIIRQEEEDAKKEREENIIRQKEDAIKKKREDNIIRQKENATEKEIGDRAIRVDYGPAPPKEDFQSRGPRGGGGGSDSSKRLYVGNLSWNVDDQALESLFSEQGKVLEARVVYDRETGRSRGFGFITYGSTEDLNNALSSLNGADLDGRNIRVSVAEERPRRF